MAESFWSTLKHEFYHRRTWPARADGVRESLAGSRFFTIGVGATPRWTLYDQSSSNNSYYNYQSPRWRCKPRKRAVFATCGEPHSRQSKSALQSNACTEAYS